MIEVQTDALNSSGACIEGGQEGHTCTSSRMGDTYLCAHLEIATKFKPVFRVITRYDITTLAAEKRATSRPLLCSLVVHPDLLNGFFSLLRHIPLPSLTVSETPLENTHSTAISFSPERKPLGASA